MSTLPELPRPAVPNTRLPIPEAFTKGSYTADQMLAFRAEGIQSLQAELEQQALGHLASEGQWIEHTGKLAAELEAARKDAERYRWLRTYPNNVSPAVYGPTAVSGSGLLRRDTYLDAAIDSALGAKEGGA